MQEQQTAGELTASISEAAPSPKRLGPFLKWAGGKRWLCQRYPHLFPTSYSDYVEPFLGSGAVFFHLSPVRSRLNDSNSVLIDTYRSIRDSWPTVYRKLSQHSAGHGEDYYYTQRSKIHTSRNDRAAQFLYLNRSCWNGLYRVNRQGIFNVPKGTKDKIILPDDNFELTSARLKSSRLYNSDFANVLSTAKFNDFAFIDPPYTVAHNVNGFIKYNENIFTWPDQIRLRDEIKRAVERGAKILLTNADHQSIRDLYDGIGKHFVLKRPTVISGSASGRRMTTELAIVIGY